MQWIKKRLRSLRSIAWNLAGKAYAAHWSDPRSIELIETTPPKPNDLEVFFDSRKEGRGIWKWRHYFDIYDKFFKKFRGRKVHVLEIGIYSGGSLDMWRDYFGPNVQITGIDIEPACKAYEQAGVRVLIGDQSDRAFLRKVVAEIPPIDIVIDDGGHAPHQQRTSLEELLPHLADGGVYLCEDVHGKNQFAEFVAGMAFSLNNWKQGLQSETDPERRSVVACSPFQASIDSVHFYPFVTVIEKRPQMLAELVAPKHGTSWQPFLK
ncbi:hypothetical protein BH10PLA2_BH10PLA2_17580 [soil metagenome]